MALVYMLAIRDPVHGLMLFTEVEKKIIDLPVFQRLRGCKQSSLAHYTYPTALTNRFEHCLGAAHVGERILRHLLADCQSESAELMEQVAKTYGPQMSAFSETPQDPEFHDAVVQGVRLACLLHDVGHLPFSHCFEEEIETLLEEASIQAMWGESAAQRFAQYGKKCDAAGLPRLKLHEYLSYAIASEHAEVRNIMGAPQDQLAHAIALDILNPVATVNGAAPCLRNVLGAVVHSEIDADRMDFLLRDSGMTGSSLGRFDIERLIKNMVLHHAPDGGLHLYPSVRGISALEGFFTARLAIYRWQYHHHNVVFYDLLVRLVIRKLLRGELDTLTDAKILQELSYDAFVGKTTPGASPTCCWIVRDDGLIWSILGELYQNARRSRRTPAVDALLVMLEELLFRSKRHVALWKDHIGYKEFANEALMAFQEEISRQSGVGHTVALEKVDTFRREGLPELKDVGPAECITKFLVTQACVGEGAIARFQKWLTEKAGNMLVDYRSIAPFRRLRGSGLSEVEVCGRGGGEPPTYQMTQVSDLLRGISQVRNQEVRFFAYVLFDYEGATSVDSEAIAKWRHDLARLLVEWVFLHDLNEPGHRTILGLPPQP